MKINLIHWECITVKSLALYCAIPVLGSKSHPLSYLSIVHILLDLLSCVITTMKCKYYLENKLYTDCSIWISCTVLCHDWPEKWHSLRKNNCWNPLHCSVLQLFWEVNLIPWECLLTVESLTLFCAITILNSIISLTNAYWQFWKVNLTHWECTLNPLHCPVP